MRGGATIDGRWRYRLWRRWDTGRPGSTFVLLNPSTANARTDDPTVRRVIGLARGWGFGSLELVNLFALRATSPDDLVGAADPVGPSNDQYLARAVRNGTVVLAWGNHGRYLGRDRQVLGMLEGARLFCLGLTKQGCPRHPLYAPRGPALVPFSPKSAS